MNRMIELRSRRDFLESVGRTPWSGYSTQDGSALFVGRPFAPFLQESVRRTIKELAEPVQPGKCDIARVVRGRGTGEE